MRHAQATTVPSSNITGIQALPAAALVDLEEAVGMRPLAVLLVDAEEGEEGVALLPLDEVELDLLESPAVYLCS